MTPGDLDTQEPFLTAEQIAVMSGVRIDTIHAYRSRGYLPAADGHVGRTPVWLASTIAAWTESRNR